MDFNECKGQQLAAYHCPVANSYTSRTMFCFFLISAVNTNEKKVVLQEMKIPVLFLLHFNV